MKIIVVGVGEVGYHIANKLSQESKDVVIIDCDGNRLKQLSESLDVHTLQGSGASPAILTQAGIKSADMIVAVTDSDEVNLVACLTSRLLSPDTVRIARIRNKEFVETNEFQQEDFFWAINPEEEVVETIMRLLDVPGAVDVVDFADGLARLIGVKIPAGSTLDGVSMLDLKKQIALKQALVTAIYRDDKVIIPRGKTNLQAGDLAYVIAKPEEVNEILTYFSPQTRPVRCVFIIGGGRVGSHLAHRLEEKGIKVKLIDRNPEQCRILSEKLTKTVVLRGDGTDHTLLQEENVDHADFFIALTNDEEENILSCLLARRLGAKDTITRVNKSAYIPLVAALGLDKMVSSRLSAVSAILRNIRQGKVVSVATLKGEEAEVIEFEALERSSVTGNALKDIKFPRQALIAAIIRDGQVIIPGGHDVVQPNDHIIVFTRREAVVKVENTMTAELNRTK